MKILKRELKEENLGNGIRRIWLTEPMEVDFDTEFPQSWRTKLRGKVIDLIVKCMPKINPLYTLTDEK